MTSENVMAKTYNLPVYYQGEHQQVVARRRRRKYLPPATNSDSLAKGGDKARKTNKPSLPSSLISAAVPHFMNRRSATHLRNTTSLMHSCHKEQKR
jgi:hypothetical protein